MDVETTRLLLPPLTPATLALLVLAALVALYHRRVAWPGGALAGAAFPRSVAPSLGAPSLAVAAPGGAGGGEPFETIDAEFEELPHTAPDAAMPAPTPLYTAPGASAAPPTGAEEAPGGLLARVPLLAKLSQLPVPLSVRSALPFVLVAVVSVAASALLLPQPLPGVDTATVEALTTRVTAAETALLAVTDDTRALDQRLAETTLAVAGLAEDRSGFATGEVSGAAYPLLPAEAAEETVSVTDVSPGPPREVVAAEDRPIATAGRNLWDCADFTTWEAAQEVFAANQPGDPNRLDIDGNGVPCESLRTAP